MRQNYLPTVKAKRSGFLKSIPGTSLHDELEIYVRCGLKPVEALISATSLPADTFGLRDRGRIEAGRRADLLLVEGDPTDDISAIRNVIKIWVNGVEALQ